MWECSNIIEKLSGGCMKRKNFKAYLEQRLDKKETQEIETAANIEFEALRMLQDDISKAIIHYMSENNIG
jgi:hypothetical protein